MELFQKIPIFLSAFLKDPAKRLGSGPSDVQELKEHQFFQVKNVESQSRQMKSLRGKT